ncbi:MAG: DUF2891 domain-containing protein [Phycisphaeraceae bacterium]|nr:DUF2891 domain-containing protein [Phycisphaeraceae bacterium]
MIYRHAEDVVDHFVAVVLTHIGREYPNKLDHVMNSAAEVKSPRELHPIFYGSFDWHSCVHGYWLLTRALRLYPSLGQAPEVKRILDTAFTDENVAKETEYLSQPLRATFERPYGWAWLLKLGAELRSPIAAGVDAHTAERLNGWSQILSPLTDAFAQRFVTFLPKATYPIRVGTHHNTAFALALSLDYARGTKDEQLTGALTSKARQWYLADVHYPAWEPDGSDFLSSGLIEVECMRRVLPASEFVPWLDRFLPKLSEQEPRTLFTPAFVSDRTDGQITHLDGLNLSRAWCWRAMAAALPESDPRRALTTSAYQIHLDAALPHVTGDYMGEHWLATFAMLALTEPA